MQLIQLRSRLPSIPKIQTTSLAPRYRLDRRRDLAREVIPTRAWTEERPGRVYRPPTLIISRGATTSWFFHMMALPITHTFHLRAYAWRARRGQIMPLR